MLRSFMKQMEDENKQIWDDVTKSIKFYLAQFCTVRRALLSPTNSTTWVPPLPVVNVS